MLKASFSWKSNWHGNCFLSGRPLTLYKRVNQLRKPLGEPFMNNTKLQYDGSKTALAEAEFEDLTDGNKIEEKPNEFYKQSKLFLVPNTINHRKGFMYLVKGYFHYLPTDEEIFNMMLLTGKYDVEKLDEHIRDIMSKPLDIPLERSSLREIPVLVEVKRICSKYQNLLRDYMPFRPEINTVGNALVYTGEFIVDTVVNEIAALKKRPKNVKVKYNSEPNGLKTPRLAQTY